MEYFYEYEDKIQWLNVIKVAYNVRKHAQKSIDVLENDSTLNRE